MAAVSPPTLSVIVPATDRPPTLGRCRAAIEPQLGPADELIVVSECVAPGPAGARNAGAVGARGDVLVFVDADVVVHADAIARLRESLAADPGLAGLFGAYDDTPEAPGTVSRFRNLLHHHTHALAAGEVASFWAGLGAVDARAFREAGGFDSSSYPEPSIEDIELGTRIVTAGGRLRCDPAIRGTHLKRWGAVGMVRTDLFKRGAPWVELLARERRAGRGRLGVLNLGWRQRIGASASLLAIAAVASRRPRLALAAVATLIAAEHRLYALLLRRLGPRRLPIAVAAHLLHHLAAAASVPLGLLRSLR